MKGARHIEKRIRLFGRSRRIRGRSRRMARVEAVRVASGPLGTKTLALKTHRRAGGSESCVRRTQEQMRPSPYDEAC